MPSASSTSGLSMSMSRRVRASLSSLRPMPQPISTASQPSIRARTASSAASASLPCWDGRGEGMALSHFTATMGQISSGTPRNTSPLPLRTAAEAASTGAPV